jgi:WD40 repeat protein
VRIWGLDARNGHPSRFKAVNGHSDFVLSVAIAPNDKWIFSSSKDKTIQVLNAYNLEHHATIMGHSNSGIKYYFNFSYLHVF